MDQGRFRALLRRFGVCWSMIGLAGWAAVQSPAATLTTLASFNGVNGRNPDSGLLADAAGNLYGTSDVGGANNRGTVFRLEAGTNTLTALASFNGVNGRFPQDNLIADAAGNLYGTASEGGASDYGTVFRLEAGTNTLTALASFNGVNGRRPFAGLIFDAAGNLYGTTNEGGTSNLGSVFRLEAGTNTLTTLASFSEAKGKYPDAGLLADSAGNLYGTTEYGGPSGYGTVFRLAAGTNTLTALASFNGANGANPFAGLIADAAGNLYGTTGGGGPGGGGTVFRLAVGTNTLTTLASFNDANGRSPLGRLIADSAGNLYGTTFLGGPSDEGTVFRLAAGTNMLTTLATFGADGARPDGNLIADDAGNLYGTTQMGGASGYGTVFRLSDAGFVVVPEPASFILSILACAICIPILFGRRHT